jgi:proline dehydrogenase
MSILDLEQIKQKIESMDKMHHIEILKILKKNPSTKLNENKSGVFINLAFLPQETMADIQEYLDYINDQESSLKSMESQKETFKCAYFQ